MTGKNRTRQGKLGCMLGERRVQSERSHGASTRDRRAETLLVGHDLVGMHRLMEMG